MTLTLTEFVGAAGGGALGAALGALGGFALLGAIVMIATLISVAVPSSTLVETLAFGPVFGPHVMFASGVAAAAYAAYIRQHDSARDITSPLIVYNKMSIIGVGAAFGMLGQLLARLVGEIPAAHTSSGKEIAMTDSLAVSVVLTALIATVLWARKPTTERQQWLPWQNSAPAVLTIGAVAGAVAGSIYLALPEESRAMAGPFLYGVSAFSLLALVFGKAVPVTHHITLTAALTAGVVAGHTSEPSLILLAAVGAGLVASVFAEVWARLMLERCKVHLDPPAAAIAIMATLLALLQLVIA